MKDKSNKNQVICHLADNDFDGSVSLIKYEFYKKILRYFLITYQ